MPKSFYDLVFSAVSGSAGKDAHYIRGTLDEVRSDLESELSQKGFNLYLLCWFGSDLRVNVYEQGSLVQTIDLHPFVKVSIDGYPDLIFQASEFPDHPDIASEEWLRLGDRVLSGELDDAIVVTVDWDRIEVPPLVGEIATKYDFVKIVDPYGDHEDLDEDVDVDSDEYLEDPCCVPYGFTDLEQ
ncbi:hypothetical protein D5S18_25080 [Nocardia panacis]|uniref:Uncharacterized protein n=1 Tax=Nocardia panacis TaxID=2340916 RepID=A0A3A4KP24_9NOCA|nr:hypothetical protein [Nocardia panacis]RJO71445.1 hypothetical protein D5S18_25080 [Nocardia panacis]